MDVAICCCPSALCVLHLPSPPPLRTTSSPNGLLECWSGQRMPRETPHCLGRGGCSTAMPQQHPQLCSPRAFLAPLAVAPSSQSPAPASSAHALLPCRESRCGQSSPRILHPTSCIPPSHISHPASLQSYNCPSHIVSDNPKSCISHPMPTSNPASHNSHPSSHDPLSQIPHPTIPYPTSFISYLTSLHPKSKIPHSTSLHPISYITDNASYILYPYSPYLTSLHAVSVHPKSHTSHPSIPYPASCISHPVSAHPIFHIPPPHATPLPADGVLHTGNPPALHVRAQAILQLTAIQLILLGVKGRYLCRESRITCAGAGNQEGTSNHGLTAPLTQSILILILEDLHLCLERQKVLPGGAWGEICPLPRVG